MFPPRSEDKDQSHCVYFHLSLCDQLSKNIDNIVNMFEKSSVLVFCLCLTILAVIGAEEAVRDLGNLVKREQRTTLVSTEYGEISAARVSDDVSGSYLLHFFTLEPNSLFLPVVLHADMVFYVHTGSGKLSWTEEDDLKSTELQRGDVYALQQGSIFFIQSNLEWIERRKLRIHAIFANSKSGLQGLITGPYSSLREMVLGFDRKVLQAAFKVSEEVIDQLLGGTRPTAIIHAVQETKRTAWGMESQFVRNLLGSRSYNIYELNKKKQGTGAKLYNLFKEDRDFENCNGWSTTVTRKKFSALKGTNFGVFMVNLTIGSMMGPHWNPRATEVAVVLQGRGMVRIVCSSMSNETTCRNMRFEVEEGDVFLVPKFHPMAQMAFNNETFVFMGFSTSAKKNHPQFLAGQASALRTLDKDVLATSFNATNTTLDELLAMQHDSVILGCISCAEEELRIMEREEERQREEEEARQREEERKREEEERKREEERKKEEEERKRKEEEARRKEEEKRRQEEEEERRRKEEEARQREEEERRRQEEEERRREQEQEQGEKAQRKEREEEEEAQRREQEQEEARQRREEEQAVEEERRREEEARREEEGGRQQERERKQEEAQQREQEQEEEEAEQRGEEARRRQQQEEEDEARRKLQEGKEEKEASWRSKEAAAAEQERRWEEAAQREEEAARQQERERERQEEEEEEGGGDEE